MSKTEIQPSLNLQPGGHQPLVITPESLYTDNTSDKAKSLRYIWRENRDAHNLRAIIKCGDSRGITPIPRETVEIGSIATGVDFDYYSGLLSHEAFSQRGYFSFGHYDGLKFKIGHMPEGCGGLGAKKEQLATLTQAKSEGIEEFIRNNIGHPDVIVQTCITAARIARKTDRQSIAGIQDHRSGEIRIVGIFSQKDSNYRTAVDPILLFQGKYKPEVIYKDGVPSIPDEYLPNETRNMLSKYNEQLQELKSRHKDLENEQETQYADMISIDADIKPAGIITPGLTACPNRIFRLNVPRQRLGNGIHIPPVALDQVLQQAEYPLTQAVIHSSDNGSFSRSRTIFINTGDMDQSVKIANQLMEKPYTKVWLTLAETQIIVAQSRMGEIAEIDYFRKSV